MALTHKQVEDNFKLLSEYKSELFKFNAIVESPEKSFYFSGEVATKNNAIGARMGTTLSKDTLLWQIQCGIDTLTDKLLKEGIEL